MDPVTEAILAQRLRANLRQHRVRVDAELGDLRTTGRIEPLGGRNLVCTNIRGVAGAHKTNLPSMGYCPLENNLVSFAGVQNLRMGTFNPSLMRHQIETWLDAYRIIDATSTAELFSSGGPYANTPPSP